MDNSIKVEFLYSDKCLYSVHVNGETLFECMGREEIENLTLSEILKWHTADDCEPSEDNYNEFFDSVEAPAFDEDDYYDDPIVQEGLKQQDVIDMYRREK